ncbi:MAG: hypothetical protein E6Q76_07365 [Rhizobium sp.]|nr:MAG: hypothetical protein E6Q76_07365 [Rhizobium sp.]
MSPAATIRFAVLLVTTLACGVANAGGIDGLLRDQFDQMGSNVNVTTPSTYVNQTRGVVNGGSVVMRVPTVNEPLYHFTPPRLNMGSGCSGFDLYGGSFSYLTGDQLENLMRGIASNAESYFFTLALKAVCPSCESLVQTAANALRQLNKYNLDSCAIAKAGLDAIADHKEADGKTVMEDLQSSAIPTFLKNLGQTKDDLPIANRFNDFANSGWAKALMQSTELSKDDLIGNLTWRTIVGSTQTGNLSALFGTSSHETNEMLLSLLGSTFVVPSQENPTQQPAQTIQPRTIHIKDLLLGSGVGKDGAKTPITVYDCPFAPDIETIRQNLQTNDCLTTSTRAVDGFTGLIPHIKLMLVGDPLQNKVGIIQKLSFNRKYADQLTPEEQAFLAVAPQTELAVLIRLGRRNVYEASEAADRFSEAIAIQFVRNFITEYDKSFFKLLASLQTLEPSLVKASASKGFEEMNAELANFEKDSEAQKSYMHYMADVTAVR